MEPYLLQEHWMSYWNYMLKLFQIKKRLSLVVVVKWKSWDPTIPKFTLRKRVWITLIPKLLEAARMNKSWAGIGNRKFYERLCSYFYSVWSLFSWQMNQIFHIKVVSGLDQGKSNDNSEKVATDNCNRDR